MNHSTPKQRLYPFPGRQPKTNPQKKHQRDEAGAEYNKCPLHISVFQARLLLKELNSGASAFLMGHKHAGWGPNLAPKQVNPAFEQKLLMLRAQNKQHCSLYARLLFTILGLIWTYSSWSHIKWLSTWLPTDFMKTFTETCSFYEHVIPSCTDREEAWLHNCKEISDSEEKSFQDSTAPRETTKRRNHKGCSTPLSSCHSIPLLLSQMVPSTSQLPFLYHHLKQ